MQGPLTIKPGTPFRQAMQEIHTAKQNQVTIDGRDYNFQWLKNSVEVSRLDCPCGTGATETVSRYTDIAGAVVRDISLSQFSPLDSGFTDTTSINSDETIPLDSMDDFGHNRYGSFKKTTETTTTSGFGTLEWDTFQTRSEQMQVEQNKLYARELSCKKYGEDFANFLRDVNIPPELTSYFERSMQDVDNGLEKFSLWAENLESSNLGPQQANKKELNFQLATDLVSDDEDDANGGNVKDISETPWNIMTDAREVYLTLCVGYLKNSVATTHRDLSREYLNNVSRFAKETAEVIKTDLEQKTVQSDVDQFSDWEDKYLPCQNKFTQHDQRRIDAQLDKLGGSERVNLIKKLGNPLVKDEIVKPNSNASSVKNVDSAPARPVKVLQSDQPPRTDTVTYAEVFLSGL